MPLAANADKVEQYKAGKEALFGSFVSQTMKAMQGKVTRRWSTKCCGRIWAKVFQSGPGVILYHAMGAGTLKLAGAATLLISVGCSSDPSNANAIPIEDVSVHAGEFFPRALYDRRAECSALEGLQLARPMMVLDDFQQEWFSGHLAAAGEKALVALAAESPADTLLMRFIWLPTFDNPVIVRLGSTVDGGRRLVAMRLSGAGGYDPGEVSKRIDRRLSDEEWRRISSLIARTELLKQEPVECEMGLDGSEWIVEAIDDDGYHFLKRWSPERGPVREFGSLLLELTGWRIGEIY